MAACRQGSQGSLVAYRLLWRAAGASNLSWASKALALHNMSRLNDGASHANTGAVVVAASLVASFGFAVQGAVQPAQAEAQASPSQQQEQHADGYQRPAVAKGLPKAITLYQYEVCPYCCKVKAFLDYYKLPYQVVEVNPLTKSELSWSSYKKVPVVKLDDDVVVDSSAIISRLAVEVEAPTTTSSSSSSAGVATTPDAPAPESAPTKSWWFGARQAAVPPAPTPTLTPPAPVADAVSAGSIEEETRWRRWVDEVLVKVLTANIYRNWDEAWKSFQYITDQTKWGWGTREVARSVGAVMMWQIGKRMPAKYKIEGDLREALYRCCNEFVDAMGSRSFMGGSKPDLADLSVYGVLSAVETTPTFQDVMQHSRIAPWYERMSKLTRPSSRLPSS